MPSGTTRNRHRRRERRHSAENASIETGLPDLVPDEEYVDKGFDYMTGPRDRRNFERAPLRNSRFSVTPSPTSSPREASSGSDSSVSLMRAPPPSRGGSTDSEDRAREIQAARESRRRDVFQSRSPTPDRSPRRARSQRRRRRRDHHNISSTDSESSASRGNEEPGCRRYPRPRSYTPPGRRIKKRERRSHRNVSPTDSELSDESYWRRGRAGYSR